MNQTDITKTPDNIRISESDVQEMKKNTGIEKEYIEKAAEHQRADKRFKEIETKEDDSDSESTSNINKLKKGIKFISKCVYMNPDTPNFAKVKEVKAPKKSNNIKLITELEYNKYNFIDNKLTKDKMSNTSEFVLNNQYDKERLNYLLEYVGVNKPSELKDKNIPTKPYQNSSRFGKTKFNYDIDFLSSDMTISDRLIRFKRRSLMRINCIERSSKFGFESTYGDYEMNKNILLYISLGLSIIEIMSDSIIIYGLLLFFVSVYIILFLYNLVYGISEILTKNKDERVYIQQKINK